MAYPLASTDQAVLQFIANQNASRSTLSTDPFTPAPDVNGIDTLTSDNVVGLSSIASGAMAIALGTGYNTVVLAGSHSTSAAASGAPDSFSFSVDQTGTATVLDNNTGDQLTISGNSFLIFNDAAAGTDANGNADFASMFYIGDANQSEVVRLYYAAFGRHADLGGVEYYMKSLAAGVGFTTIANNFMASPEFVGRFGATSADMTFVTDLYANVLARAPSAAEVSYYTAALANQEAGSIVNTTNPVMWSRAQVLLNFTNSSEDQNDVSGFVINTSQNAYADSTVRIADSTVLTEAAATNYVNTALIDPITITTNIFTTANGVTSTSFGSNDVLSLSAASAGVPISINLAGNNITAVLSSTVNGATILGSGDVVYGYAGGGSEVGIANQGGTAYLSGNNNEIDYLETGKPFATPATIYGFNSTDFFELGSGGGTVELLSGSVNGASLFIGSVNRNLYVMNVGTVGGGSAAEVAAAANKLYTVADANYEGLVFYGETAAGGTAIYDWHGQPPATTTADSGLTKLVEPTDFRSGFILVGVSPTVITAGLFH